MADFIWTGVWADAREFMDRVGYVVPFLGSPALYICGDCEQLHVANQFSGKEDVAELGERIRWYHSTKTFSIIR